MTTQREAFEKWATANSYSTVKDWEGVGFANGFTAVMYDAWLASRSAALEEAAKVCDRKFAQCFSEERRNVAASCADLIRALAKRIE